MDTKFVSLISGIRQIQAPPSLPEKATEGAAAAEKTAQPGSTAESTLEKGKAADSAAPAEQESSTVEASLDDVVEELNRTIQQQTRALKFTIDERQGKPVVSVVDKETDEVIRQIPSEVALQVADALEDVTGALVSEHA